MQYEAENTESDLRSKKYGFYIYLSKLKWRIVFAQRCDFSSAFSMFLCFLTVNRLRLSSSYTNHLKINV